ncbi:NUDIX hydrolase [Nocardiopsis exhalans]
MELVALSVRDKVACVLVQDDALPGSPMDVAEELAVPVRHSLAALCGPASATWPLGQVGAYGGAAGAVRVAYRVLCPPSATANGGQWAPAVGVFDPAVVDALGQLAQEIELTTAAAALCPHPEFTISDLRNVYEALWEAPLDSGNFHRSVRRNPAAWVDTGGRRTGTGGRAAALYRAGTHRLTSPVLRPLDSCAGSTR